MVSLLYGFEKISYSLMKSIKVCPGQLFRKLGKVLIQGHTKKRSYIKYFMNIFFSCHVLGSEKISSHNDKKALSSFCHKNYY